MRGHLRLPETITACLFDLDGVLTRTAELHAEAWMQTFDAFLNARGGFFAPFDAVADYDAYVDGKLRDDGVRSFLASRGIELAEGAPTDPPSAETVHGLGLRKNELVHELMARRGVAAYKGSVRFLAAAGEAGLRRPVVTSSENADAVLHAAGLDGPSTSRSMARSRARSASRASPRPTYSSRRRDASASSRDRLRCSRTPWPAAPIS